MRAPSSTPQARRISGLLVAFVITATATLALAAAPGVGWTDAPVSTAGRAHCTAGKGVCARVTGHRRHRLALVLRTRRVRKNNYGVCVRTSRHPSNWRGRDSRQARSFTLCRSFRLARSERDATFIRVPNGFRSRVVYRRIWPFTGPGRYSACWTWGDVCGSRRSLKRLQLARIVFWVKRNGRVIVRRP